MTKLGEGKWVERFKLAMNEGGVSLSESDCWELVAYIQNLRVMAGIARK